MYQSDRQTADASVAIVVRHKASHLPWFGWLLHSRDREKIFRMLCDGIGIGIPKACFNDHERVRIVVYHGIVFLRGRQQTTDSTRRKNRPCRSRTQQEAMEVGNWAENTSRDLKGEYGRFNMDSLWT